MVITNEQGWNESLWFSGKFYDFPIFEKLQESHNFTKEPVESRSPSNSRASQSVWKHVIFVPFLEFPKIFYRECSKWVNFGTEYLSYFSTDSDGAYNKLDFLKATTLFRDSFLLGSTRKSEFSPNFSQVSRRKGNRWIFKNISPQMFILSLLFSCDHYKTWKCRWIWQKCGFWLAEYLFYRLLSKFRLSIFWRNIDQFRSKSYT